MNKKSTSGAARALREAACPKDIFGDIPRLDRRNRLEEAIKNKENELEETLSRSPGAKKRFQHFAKWARLICETLLYDDEQPYYRTLFFKIEERDGQRMFCLQSKENIVFESPGLAAQDFKPAFQNDMYAVTRDSTTISEGSIFKHRKYRLFVFMPTEARPNSAQVFNLIAQGFKLGDMIEIRTCRLESDKDLVLRMAQSRYCQSVSIVLK